MKKSIICFEKINKSSYLVFLAGGITNCPPWQPELIKKLDAYCLADLVLLNPRRNDFDITNPNMSKEQINWEHFMLAQANLVSFWFSAGPSMQPITLYEYGKILILSFLIDDNLIGLAYRSRASSELARIHQ